MTDKPIINAAASDLAWSMLSAALDALTEHDQPALIRAYGEVELRILAVTHGGGFPAVIPHISLAAERLSIDSSDHDELTFECPWCHEKNIRIVDVDIDARFTTQDEPEPDNVTDRDIVFDYRTETNYSTLYYRTTCCAHPISLPVGWSGRSN